MNRALVEQLKATPYGEIISSLIEYGKQEEEGLSTLADLLVSVIEDVKTCEGADEFYQALCEIRLSNGKEFSLGNDPNIAKIYSSILWKTGEEVWDILQTYRVSWIPLTPNSMGVYQIYAKDVVGHAGGLYSEDWETCPVGEFGKEEFSKVLSYANIEVKIVDSELRLMFKEN